MNSSEKILEILITCIQEKGITEKECLIKCGINTSFLVFGKNNQIKSLLTIRL